MKIGTSPVRNAYIALAHTDISADLEGVQGFLHVANYPAQDSILESEVGTAGNVRFMLSSEGSMDAHASGNGNDVYNALISGMEAATVVRQDRYLAKFIHHPAKYNGPMELFDTIAWKMATACKIVNDQWIAKLRITLLN